MSEFKRISVDEANAIISSNKQAQIVDIRDENSFAQGHINNATHLGNHNLHNYVNEADLDQPLLVYCYHGNSSQSAANYLASQGFTEAYSVDGGYEVWRTNTPQ